MLAFLAALLLGYATVCWGATYTPTAAIPEESGFSGAMGTRSSESMDPGELRLGGSGLLMRDVSIFRNAQVTSSAGTSVLSDAWLLDERSFLALGVGKGFDLSLSLPYFYEDLEGRPGTPDDQGSGDFSTGLKFSVPWKLRVVSFALMADGAWPTSSDKHGFFPRELSLQPSTDSFPNAASHPYGAARARGGLGLAATLDFTRWSHPNDALLHFNISEQRGLSFSQRDPLGSMHVSLAGELRMFSLLRLEAEIRHDRLSADKSPFGPVKTTATAMGLGLGFVPGWGFALRAGVLVGPDGLNDYIPLQTQSRDGPRSFEYRRYPTVSAFLGVSWQGFLFFRDTDHDGIPDDRDRCPDAPEDKDGFQDEDGCPDFDNDGDGIPDSLDKCPYAAEDKDGFEDNDGCPDLDNDQDGIPDALDKCPNEPEDKDGFQDEDGCPDPDNDHDGIPDSLDKCPNEPENFNGFEDQDGCPEKDTDGDGIPDGRDKCPTEKEIINFYQDEDGCPDEKPDPIRNGILDSVEFTPGTAELLPSSWPALDSVALKLQIYPGTEVEIQGHVDTQTKDAQAVSYLRAKSVAEYLVSKGIEASRLKAVGYGGTRPIASNRTAKGRETNRRIEIRRLN